MTSKITIPVPVDERFFFLSMSARVLKECSSEIAPILACIYNESLAQGAVPDDW